MELRVAPKHKKKNDFYSTRNPVSPKNTSVPYAESPYPTGHARSLHPLARKAHVPAVHLTLLLVGEPGFGHTVV